MATLHTYSNRHIKDQVFNIKKGDWVVLENRLSKKWWSLYFKYNNIDEIKLNLTYITKEEYFQLEGEKMKKFKVVGNPPYQDGTRKDQQNKIYNQFSKQAIEIGDDISYTTPISVLKKSKRFSLVGMPGLKKVDFTADAYYNEGVKICDWHVDKNYNGDVEVVDSNGNITYIKNTKIIYDYAVVDRKVAKIVENIREETVDLSKRMFPRNNPGPTTSKTKDNDYKYALLHIQKDRSTTVNRYVKREPYHYKKKKFIMPMTRSFTEDNVIISTDDYDDATVCVDIKNKTQISNLKSFLFSEYFVNFVNEWKILNGYGFNETIKYFPKFDKDKHWTNDEVKEFIESYVK